MPENSHSVDRPWKRREPGSYIAEVDGQRYTLVNMKSGGPNAPRWQGPVPAWEVRLGGEGDYDIGAKVLHVAWTMGEAKRWLRQHHAKLSHA